jgi:hypothetical protein
LFAPLLKMLRGLARVEQRVGLARAHTKEKPARRRKLAGGLVLATARRVVVSSMPILPMGRVAVESMANCQT